MHITEETKSPKEARRKKYAHHRREEEPKRGKDEEGCTCRISLETLRGRSELSTMPLMKDR